jgi:hypothetical protein
VESSLSNSFQRVPGPLILNVSGVESRGWFEQDNPAFFFRGWAVLYSTRHHDKLAGFDPFMMVEKIHAEAAFDDQKHFVFVLVMVKDKLAVQLNQLDLLSVELGGDARVVVVGDPGELLGNVDFEHGSLDG